MSRASLNFLFMLNMAAASSVCAVGNSLSTQSNKRTFSKDFRRRYCISSWRLPSSNRASRSVHIKASLDQRSSSCRSSRNREDIISQGYCCLKFLIFMQVSPSTRLGTALCIGAETCSLKNDSTNKFGKSAFDYKNHL
ncbi:hypothetical protein K1719_042983 [Acacia pycnantha]|nr:hypothetical protein K1719_042983 [Acacia pycnantha]